MDEGKTRKNTKGAILTCFTAFMFAINSGEIHTLSDKNFTTNIAWVNTIKRRENYAFHFGGPIFFITMQISLHSFKSFRSALDRYLGPITGLDTGHAWQDRSRNGATIGCEKRSPNVVAIGWTLSIFCESDSNGRQIPLNFKGFTSC